MPSRFTERCNVVLLKLEKQGRQRTASWLAWGLAALRGRDIASLHSLVRLSLERHDFDRVPALCEEILRKSPDDALALDVLGRLHLQSGATEKALQRFRRHAELTFGAGASATLYHEQRLDIEKSKRSIPFYRRLENVLVDTAYWTIMAEGGVLYSVDTHGKTVGNSPFVQGRIARDSVIVAHPHPIHHVEEECIFVGGDENYSHWLFRNLMKLSVLDDDGLVDSLPWLLNRDLAGWQEACLAMLGVGPQRRILVDRGQVVHCSRLVVPALHTNAATIGGGIEWLQRRFSAHMTPLSQADARIYVSREDASFRHVVNEAELFGQLETLGFHKVVPGRLEVAEQIRIFSSAAVIVAVHGAGLTNMVFTPRHAAIVEINNAKLQVMSDFRRIAKARDQHIETVVSDTYADPHEPAHVNSDYFVDVDEVMRRVRTLLHARKGGNFVDPTAATTREMST